MDHLNDSDEYVGSGESGYIGESDESDESVGAGESGDSGGSGDFDEHRLVWKIISLWQIC